MLALLDCEVLTLATDCPTMHLVGLFMQWQPTLDLVQSRV